MVLTLRRGRVPLGGILAACACAGVATLAQSSQAPTFRAGVDIVELDVTVLGKDRLPVRGLRVEDFTVLEDGKVRPIAAFTAVDLTKAAAVGPTAGAAPGSPDAVPPVANLVAPVEGRAVVILMDRSIPNGTPTQIARKVATAAVEEMGPGDLAAVIYTGHGTSQDLTRDRARLLARIVGGEPAAGLGLAAREAWEIANDRLEAELWEDDRIPRLLPKFDYNGECLCGLCVLETITEIADALRDVPKRSKSLLFVGTDVIVESTEVQCTSKVRDARSKMFRALDLSHVTVHAFDAMGLETRAIPASSTLQGKDLTTAISPRADALAAIPAAARKQLVRQGNLSVLPDHTGGRTTLNTNDPDLLVPAVFTENSSYYLLGFQPASGTDTRIHSIGVKVKGKDVKVSARRSYVRAGQGTPRND